MKVQLELNEEQAETMKQALELYARIGMGQLHDILRHPVFLSRDVKLGEAERLLVELKELIRLQGKGHTFGISNEHTPEASREAFDIYQVLRHQLAWHRNPQGTKWNVNFDEPMPFSRQPLPVCRVDE